MVLDGSRSNGDDADMPVPEEVRARLARWCAERVTVADRDRHQVGYTIHGDEIVVADRRPPAYPELGAAWTSSPLARLRRTSEGWVLLRPSGENGWIHAADGDDPVRLLERELARP